MKGFLAVLLLAAAVVAETENQCPSQQETDWQIELLLRHEDCTKFYKCTYGQPVEQDCADGLYFNLNNWQCDWPQNVDCEGRYLPEEEDNISEVAPETEETAPELASQEESAPEIPESEVETEPEQTETEDSQAEEDGAVLEPEEESEPEVEEAEDAQEPDIEFLENGCPVDPHIHWLLPHEDDCNQYYYCVWGGKELRSCASTLHFNPVLQVCDWPAEAGCALSANRHFGYRTRGSFGLQK